MYHCIRYYLMNTKIKNGLYDILKANNITEVRFLDYCAFPQFIFLQKYFEYLFSFS